MGRRRKLIAGNWKMFTTLPEALELVTELKRLVSMARQVDIAVVPPALFVEPVSRRLADSNIGVGVQNIYSADFGAFTGELSSQMLSGMNVSYCLAGHSERRQYFGDTDEVVNGKVKAIFAQEVTPIFCIGESLAEREGDRTFAVLGRQMKGGLADINAEQASTIVVAYEPVWAIGTGLTASAEQVAEVHAWLRGWLSDNYGKEVAERIRIQYGGSVKPENAAELLHTPNVDGALVGGAALKADSFAKIVKAGFK
jgi:triosephosphate isomerase (TIM)